MKIRTDGSSTKRHAPQRATLRITVRKSGTGSREDYVRPVLEQHTKTMAQLNALRVGDNQTAGIYKLTSSSMNVQSYKMWNEAQKSHELNHDVSVPIVAEFRDWPTVRPRSRLSSSRRTQRLTLCLIAHAPHIAASSVRRTRHGRADHDGIDRLVPDRRDPSRPTDRDAGRGRVPGSSKGVARACLPRLFAERTLT